MHVKTHMRFSTSVVFKSMTRNFSIYVKYLRKPGAKTLSYW